LEGLPVPFPKHGQARKLPQRAASMRRPTPGYFGAMPFEEAHGARMPGNQPVAIVGAGLSSCRRKKKSSRENVRDCSFFAQRP
jgi:hypothetical protein